MSDVAIVTTTIREPKFLFDVSENAMQYEKKDLSFYIIGDKKTPNSAKELCISLEKQYPYSYNYYSPEDQESALSSHRSILNIIPYNSGVRKLLGNIIAYQHGCQTTIQLDDDNFVRKDDFIGGHSCVGKEMELALYQSPTGWYNVYEQLIEERGIPFFPRGFPWSKRDYSSEKITKVSREKRRVVLINGLVFEDPDIDAISRLFWPIRVVGLRPTAETNFGLYPATWCAFNNQNTSTSIDLTPIYFTPCAGHRNSDIWTSFLICKLVECTGEVVAFGAPFVDQIRNPHNLWDDLEEELESNKATDEFVSLLRSIELKETSYRRLLAELISKCLKKLEDAHNLKDSQREMIMNYFTEYKIWSDTF